MSEEFLDIVDENDNVVGKGTRSRVHDTNSWHRGVHVILINENGEIAVELRGLKQDSYPGCYGVSMSEHVRSGESYAGAVSRGLGEELGITAANPKKLIKFRMVHGQSDRMMGNLYELHHGGKIRTDKKEIQALEFFPPDKLREMLESRSEKFARWAYEILRWYFGMPSKLEEL